MLAIRLARAGKKNKAQFRIVLQENSVAPGGRHVAVLGSYDPHRKTATFQEEKIKYWLGKGAQASDTVYNLLVSRNIISGKKRPVKMPKKAEKTEEAKPEAKIQEKTTEESQDKADPAPEEIKEKVVEEKKETEAKSE